MGERAEASTAAIAVADAVVGSHAAVEPLHPPEIDALRRAVSGDAFERLYRFARERCDGEPVASGLRVRIAAARSDVLYLHWPGGTHVLAVPRVAALAVIDRVEVYRLRGGEPVLHRAASQQLRDARCRDCFTWTELAAAWSIASLRDTAAIPTAVALSVHAARHCALPRAGLVR